MVQRVIKGRSGAGQFGFWVSKPGIDVMSANIMQMAFSSDFIPPKAVMQELASGERADQRSRPIFGQRSGAWRRTDGQHH